jgi:hypothetical protein
VWQQCEGSTTMSKAYPVTSCFILEQNIVAYKEIEHCFHSHAAVCTGIWLVLSCLVEVASLPISKCIFNADLQKEYSFIKKNCFWLDIRCSTCSSCFSISHRGHSDIKSHRSTDKHKRPWVLLHPVLLSQLFFLEVRKGTEGRGNWRNVRISHSAAQSFRSMDYTSKLIQCVFEPKFTCACTKAEIIVLNMLTLFALSELQSNI